jgi:hypothetical protein
MIPSIIGWRGCRVLAIALGALASAACEGSNGGCGSGGAAAGSGGAGLAPPGSGGTGTGGSGSGGIGSAGGHGSGGMPAGTGGKGSGGAAPGGSAGTGTSPMIAGCPILPADHIFNTPIDGLPVDPHSASYLGTIGTHNLHLDLGQSTDISMADTYYGIPYNVVHGATQAWGPVYYRSADPDVNWDPRPESDCVDMSSGAAHTEVSPCTAAAAAKPVFPIPAMPLVEGGIDTDPAQPYGDHHILLLDADTCILSELYHAYPHSGGGWDIFGSAMFDLRSNELRPDGWTSADAAGFPITPLLLRADEASAGRIDHALRFTITSSKIRNQPIWPARHYTTNGTTSTNLPPMGQLFRLKASYQIPSSFNTQSRAILQAMKTYGMYIADGGSDMYVTGEPSAAWMDATFSQVQSVGSGQFEAVDITAIMQRPGFDPNSAAVPPP